MNQSASPKDLAYQLLLAGDSGYISAAYENLSRAYSRIDLLGLFRIGDQDEHSETPL